MPSQKKVPVNRTMVGLISLACLAAFVALYFFVDEDKKYAMLAAAFGRVGLLMGAFWLALPTKTRDAAWKGVSPLAALASVVMIVVIAVRPKVGIPLAAVMIAAAYVLRPRDKQRPPRAY